MTIMDLISRHLPGLRHDDYDAEVDARQHHAHLMGHDLPREERLARALRGAQDAPLRYLDRTG